MYNYRTCDAASYPQVSDIFVDIKPDNPVEESPDNSLVTIVHPSNEQDDFEEEITTINDDEYGQLTIDWSYPAIKTAEILLMNHDNNCLFRSMEFPININLKKVPRDDPELAIFCDVEFIKTLVKQVSLIWSEACYNQDTTVCLLSIITSFHDVPIDWY